MMMVAPPLVLFSNPENTDPTYSKFGSSLQQDLHFRCPTHADSDVSANVPPPQPDDGTKRTSRTASLMSDHQTSMLSIIRSFFEQD
jgi:hypothetical protein